MQAKAAAERAVYGDSEEALLTVLAIDRRGPLEGVTVRVEVTTPSGIGRAAETVTSADGAASLTYMTDAARDGEGVYAIDALASRDGYDSVLASATFEVTGGTAEAGRRTQR